ncbi:uncharacterized protein gprin1 [Diretmus argenteus]
MGSLKDEMRGLAEDHQSCEVTEDGEYPGSSDSSHTPEGQMKTSQQPPTQEDYQSKHHMNTSYIEERDGDPISKDPAITVGVCGKIDHPDSVKDCTQTDIVTLTQQPDADKTSTVNPSIIKNEETILTQSAPKFTGDLSPLDGGTEIQGESSMDKDVEKEEGNEAVKLHASSTPDHPVPCSPAPPGQQHIRTQVSLEVVQCHSAATSPMTPPEGDHAFFFPNSFGRSGAVGAKTKDAELQVGQRVEFCSVATGPMTPKTPPATSFPEVSGRETGQMEENMRQSVKQDSFPVTKSSSEAESELIPALKITTAKELTEGTGFNSNTSPESSINFPAIGLTDSQVTPEDGKQQCRQHAQKMRSMDQDITILVTHHGHTETEDEEGGVDTESSIHPIVLEVKIDEYNEFSVNSSEAEEKTIKLKPEVGEEDTMEKISTHISKDGKNNAPSDVQDTAITNTNPPQNKINTEEPPVPVGEHPETGKDHLAQNKKSGVKETKEDACFSEELKEASPVPHSPAPSGGHHIHTQVSLEVVQCHSAATSPMTPPEGDHAFFFPNSFGRSGAVGAKTKDAELQVGQQVECRSVATGPMTPKTPTTPTGFPEIRKEDRIEKILEEDEDKGKNKSVTTERAEDKEEAFIEKEKKAEASAEQQEEQLCKEYEEPVQEVSWDEKGMTWEVYGAVVEVAVLGSAIQKHLEKQVKKHKKQPALPPPPPLSPSATPFPPDSAQGCSGKGRAGKRRDRDGKVSRRRRNPFRLLLQNMQQPHCCSRAHTTE